MSHDRNTYPSDVTDDNLLQRVAAPEHTEMRLHRLLHLRAHFARLVAALAVSGPVETIHCAILRPAIGFAHARAELVAANHLPPAATAISHQVNRIEPTARPMPVNRCRIESADPISKRYQAGNMKGESGRSIR
jgi:hypothetical protein